MQCPKCGSESITPSHKRGLEKALQYVYPKAPFRCKECWSRFWKFQNPFVNRKSLIGISILAVLVLLFLVLPFFPDFTTGGSSTGPESKPLPVETPQPDPWTSTSLETELDEEVEPEAPVETKMTAETKAPEIGPPPEDETNIYEPPQAEKTEDLTASSQVLVEPESPAPAASETPVAADPPKPKTPEKKVDRTATKPKGQIHRVTAVRQMEGEGGFKMAMAFSGQLKDYRPKAMTIFDSPPPRLVLDFKGNWDIESSLKFPMEDDLVMQVRVGEHTGYLRIVLDLKRAATVRHDIQKTDTGLILTLKEP